MENEVLATIDKLLNENRAKEAEEYMHESIKKAMEEGNNELILTILNELIGFYREQGRVDDSLAVSAKAEEMAIQMGLEGTIAYANTLQNKAGALRAAGKLEESISTFREVEDIYKKLLPPDHILVANLKNNISLAFQELSDFESAKTCQLEALEIVKKEGDLEKIATSLANLAATCVKMNNPYEAIVHASESIDIYEGMGSVGSHAGAAFSAMGDAYLALGKYQKAYAAYIQARRLVEENIGRNQGYARLTEKINDIEKRFGIEPKRQPQDKADTDKADSDKADKEAIEKEEKGLGRKLCRQYYEEYGKPMLEKDFAEYKDKITTGLVGRGSDCFGFDDALSRDHDWGPEFCIWVDSRTYDEIGERLEEAYAKLPTEFKGYKRAPYVSGRKRRGVMILEEFLESFIGTAKYNDIDWRNVEDYNLAGLVNGEIYNEGDGKLVSIRNEVAKGYPTDIFILKIAQSAAKFSQNIQYNYPRLMKRGDTLSARLVLMEGIKEAMRLAHYIENRYPLHDKWLATSLGLTKQGRDILSLLIELEKTSKDVAQTTALADNLGEFFAQKLYAMDCISDINPYLDYHTEEMLYKAKISNESIDELSLDIAKLEFVAFDKVQNEGGRASCQNNWPTFKVMRTSQYLTWSKAMLVQYLYDFDREYRRGHNLITEKYGRMMESTAPEKYNEIKDNFPPLSNEKKAIINQVCALQVADMEEFAKEYPNLADNARSIHTFEDNAANTSYETYLRGELGTYSDKMLQLYAGYVVDHAKSGRNIAKEIMEQSIKMYGYKTLEEANEKMAPN